MTTIPFVRAAAMAAAAAALVACSAATETGARGANRNVITHAEIAASHHTTAHALIQDLRPHWLETRGSAARVPKRVYLDALLLGRLEQLRQVPTLTIDSLRYYDGPAATQRWGADHGGGVIQIWSRSGG